MITAEIRLVHVLAVGVVLVVLAVGVTLGTFWLRDVDPAPQIPGQRSPAQPEATMPRNERVTNNFRRMMERRGLQVLAIAFEQDETDRDRFVGNVRVIFQGEEEEVRSNCILMASDNDLIASNDCPGLDSHAFARVLRNDISRYYATRNIEVLDVVIDWQQGDRYDGHVDFRDPDTGQVVRNYCESPATSGVDADWECLP